MLASRQINANFIATKATNLFNDLSNLAGASDRHAPKAQPGFLLYRRMTRSPSMVAPRPIVSTWYVT